MNFKWKLGAAAISILLLGACSSTQSGEQQDDSRPGHHMNGSGQTENHMDSMPGHESMNGQMENGMMQGHMDHDNLPPVNDSTGENPLAVPPALERGKDGVTYTVRAQKGKTEIFNGKETATLGYNGSFLGPMLRLEKGEKVKIRTINELDEETSFHWHGLEVAGESDGGPHEVIAAGEEKVIEFDVIQEAATLWFHPHPIGKTAKQVYNGLAGLVYVEDENSKKLNLPSDHGVNDFPLIFQDKIFDENNELNYRAAMNDDGTVGDKLLINGTFNPKLTVKKEKVRLRLLNGSNARNYTFRLNSGDPFAQISTDGGFLNEPLELTEITLTPSERAEIVVDFAALADVENLALINEDDSVLLPIDVLDEAGEQRELPAKMNDFSITEEEMKLPVSKKVEMFGMMKMVRMNGKKFDPDRIDMTQKQGETEIWEIYNKPDMMGGMIHPFHLHGTQFKVISRNGKAPGPGERGWKDSISVEADETVKIAVKFKLPGVYMFHCHILEHEDNGMMGQIKVE